MRVQLWSYNYRPEPSGIGPLSAVWAEALQARDHEVTVVAAHPHYPQPLWGRRLWPYRERRNGVHVVRLPLAIGRDSTRQRLTQEASFASALGAAAPLLPPADAIVAVSPSFPALALAMLQSRLRRTPWALWLQDILPDGAATTGLVGDGALLRTARRFELAAYRSAQAIVVISEVFRRNLQLKGVPEEKLHRVYNPSPIEPPSHTPSSERRAGRLLVMGNIGHSQGLSGVIEALQHDEVLDELDLTLCVAGHGVAVPAVERVLRTPRVEMAGLLMGEEMEAELARAKLGLITQRSDVAEFNLPSKLMNYMAHGVPVLGIVRNESETARIIRDSGAGWVVPSSDLSHLGAALRTIVQDDEELKRRGFAGHRYASENFTPNRVAMTFERVLLDMVHAGGLPRSKTTVGNLRRRWRG
jgi:colanic acid biosynthesis glycosyl transferase WcaI